MMTRRGPSNDGLACPPSLSVVASPGSDRSRMAGAPRQFALPLQGPETPSEETSVSSPRLRRLLDIARRNEAAWRRFQDLQLALMDCEDTHELSLCLEQHTRRHFDWACVHLHLTDPSKEWRPAHRLAADQSPHTLTWLTDSSPLKRLWPREARPILDRYRAHSHARWLPRAALCGVESLALLPVVRRRVLLGVLAIGARSPGRFRPGMGTDFLEALAATLASCVEAAGSRALLRRMSATDPLTGLGNRRHFEQCALALGRAAATSARPLGCLVIDVDHFKRINDSFGHPTGDAVLAELAGRLCKDGSEAAIISRLGGEEFALLLPGQDLAGSLELAKRVRAGVAAQGLSALGQVIPVTISVGLAQFSAGEVAAIAPEHLAASLLARADRALYRAKRNGRDRVEVEEDCAERHASPILST